MLKCGDIAFDIENRIMYVNGKTFNIDYEHYRRCAFISPEEEALEAIAHRVYYDFCVDGFWVNDDVEGYGTDIHERPEFISDLVKMLPKAKKIDDFWRAKSKTYELHRQYRYDAILCTQNGDVPVKLMVGCHEEPVYCKGKLEQPPTVNVGCTIEGKEYWGHGSDYLWIDAFAILQRQLPEGVLLKCCLTCRHGNLCPVGNNVNEVFCTKDVLITQKSDLYFYTEDHKERENRSRQYCGLCEGYHPQTDGFYTYNDYFLYLKKA